MGCVLVVTLAAAGTAQATPVNISLEPNSTTVMAGDPFALELWVRRHPGEERFEMIKVEFEWDDTYVRLDGMTKDGYYSQGNFQWKYGDEAMVAFASLSPYSGPTTDVHVVTLDFTALSFTDSTPITIRDPASSSTMVAQIIDWYGNGPDVPIDNVFGADIAIVPEPTTFLLFGLGTVMLRRKRN